MALFEGLQSRSPRSALVRAKHIVITTVLFVIAGAGAGAVVAFASLAPIWLGMTPLRGALINSWFPGIVGVMGAVFGALLMPVFGWLVIDRVGFWRAVLEPTVAAIVCAILASFALRSLQTDVLVGGAFFGALLATARLRLSSKRKTWSGAIEHVGGAEPL